MKPRKIVAWFPETREGGAGSRAKRASPVAARAPDRRKGYRRIEDKLGFWSVCTRGLPLCGQKRARARGFARCSAARAVARFSSSRMTWLITAPSTTTTSNPQTAQISMKIHVMLTPNMTMQALV